MRLKSLHLKHFRGFSDLTISDIPASARLVMLIGPNGSGKSSIFDALLTWSGGHGGNMAWNEYFHAKQAPLPESFAPNWANSIEVKLHGADPRDVNAWKRAVYVRSAYRNESSFDQGRLGNVPDPFERHFHRTTENDAAASRNYQRLVLKAIADVYGADRSEGAKSLDQYRASVVDRVNGSLGRTIPHLRLKSLGRPDIGSGNFYFEKGVSKDYLFMNLSGGEKAVFDLIVDLISRAQLFDDSLICIDEPEAHVNPAVQGSLLDELLSLTPEGSQLIVATHAIGMLRRARDIDAKSPGSVCFIDFEGEFDEPRTLGPSVMDRPRWQRSLAVAIDDLSALVAPKRIIICEGGAGGRFDPDALDGQVYNCIFAASEPDTLFYSAGSHDDTKRSLAVMTSLSQTALPGLQVCTLIDRDDRSESEVARERASGRLVLGRRNLESYLFSDEILRTLCEREGNPDVFGELLAERARVLKEKQAPIDDFKAAAGEVYVKAKRFLGLRGAGNNTKAFMIETLAPLVAPGTETYKQLEADIFGR